MLSRTPLVAIMVAAASLASCKHEPRTPPPPARDASGASASRVEAGLRYWLPASAAEALREVLRGDPRVIGFGEYHQKQGAAPGVASSVKRFSGALLDALAPRASDLIVETWMTVGSCGEEEKQVVREVETTTRRPAETESEVVTLLKRAKGLGVQPHILTLACREYQELLGGGDSGKARGKRSKQKAAAKAVDYERLLSVVTRHLKTKTLQVLELRGKRGEAREAGPDPARRVVLVYGGAIHNDRFPLEELEDFSYAGAIDERTGDRFVEVDLFVPEYIEGDRDLAKQPWFPLLRHAAAERLLLIERGERSFVLVLPRSRPAPGR